MPFSLSLFIFFVLSHFIFPAYSFAVQNVTVQVSNQSGDPVEYVVVSAFDTNTELSVANLNKIRVIDQIDKEFFAYVTPIQVGTAIEFPNHDQIRHHVYSFSTAKTFEIPLYEGLPANPIVFEKTGAVALGCNIHDWMSAYVYIVDTPYFTITDKNGMATLQLPVAEYELRYWHPQMNEKKSQSSQQVVLTMGSNQSISNQLELKQTWSFRRGPLSSTSRGRYR